MTRIACPAHPGQFVRMEIIEPLGLCVTAAAKILGVTRPALSTLLNGHASLSPGMALGVEKAFGPKMDTFQVSRQVCHARSVLLSLPAPIGRSGAALDGGYVHDPALRVHIKENPPVADATAKGGALILEPLDIASERIRTHLLDGSPEPFLVMPRCARDDLLRALSRDDGPGLGRAHRRSRTLLARSRRDLSRWRGARPPWGCRREGERSAQRVQG